MQQTRIRTTIGTNNAYDDKGMSTLMSSEYPVPGIQMVVRQRKSGGEKKLGRQASPRHNEPDVLSNQKIPWDPAEIPVF